MPSPIDSTAVLLQILPPLEPGWHYEIQDLPFGAVPLPCKDPNWWEQAAQGIDGGHLVPLLVGLIVAYRKIKGALNGA
jgi:hypothetical protein